MTIGRQRGVEGAQLQGPVEEGGQDLGRGVVDRRFDQIDPLGRGEGCPLAVEGAQDVGQAVEVAAAGAVADPVVGQLGKRQESASRAS